MKCPHCQKEISEADSLYCPYCGKKLTQGSVQKKIRFNTPRAAIPFLWWFVVCAPLAILLTIAEVIVTNRVNGGWAELSLFVAAPGIYIASVYVIYDNAKRYGRNAVAWATAAIVFSPILAGIAYGLTWPKNQQIETVTDDSSITESMSEREGKNDTVNYCPSCGNEVSKNMTYCPQCGRKLKGYYHNH